MYVTEFTDSGYAANGSSLGAEPAAANQAISFTGTPGTSAAFKNNTKLVRVAVDGVASIAFGTAPTAVANTDRRMGAGQVEYFLVPVGGAYKVSAITTTV